MQRCQLPASAPRALWGSGHGPPTCRTSFTRVAGGMGSMPQPGAGWAAGSRVGVPAHGGKNGGRSRGPRGEVGLRGEGGHMTPCFRCWLCKHVDASPLTVENGSAQPAAPLPTAPASRPTAGPVGMWLGSALPEGERGMADGGGGTTMSRDPCEGLGIAGQGGNSPKSDGDRPAAVSAQGLRLLLDPVWNIGTVPSPSQQKDGGRLGPICGIQP